MRKEELTPGEVRRIALHAQGFCDRKPEGDIGRRHMMRALGRTKLLQIDSVNVVARAHLMPLYSRLGAYPLELLERAASRRPRALFEYWAHEASLLPVETQPLLRWRMQRAEAGLGTYKALARFGRERANLIKSVRDRVEREGPLAASNFEGSKGSGGWWGWSEIKMALEWLFWAGHITTHSRRPSFERLYDLPERVLPEAIIHAPTPHPHDAQRRLMELAAAAHGVATESDMRDYFRLSPADSKPRIAELVEEGTIHPVHIKGWKQQAYLHRDSKLPRKPAANTLLSPFDPLIWERSRTERIFDFHYRIEIYVPAEKRRHGYYVLPFLLGDRLVGRVDLKADRAQKVLRVMAAHGETTAPDETGESLDQALNTFAEWLELDRVDVEKCGDLAPRLLSTR